jgi:hypothetical protein
MPTRAFNHVAVSVTDIESAMGWYRDVIQMTLLVEPGEITTYEKEQEKYDPHLATLEGQSLDLGLESSRFVI